MSDSPAGDAAKSFAELDRLLASYCDGTLTVHTWQRVEALLLEDPAARRHFVHYLHVHAIAERFLETGEPVVGTGNLESEILYPHSPAPTLQPRAASPALGFLARTSTAISKPVLWSILGVGLLFFSYVAVITWGIRDRAPHDARLTAASTQGMTDAVATITDSSDAKNLSENLSSAESDVGAGKM